MNCTAARLDGSFLGKRGPSQALVWLLHLIAVLQIDGIRCVRVHSLSRYMSRIQD